MRQLAHAWWENKIEGVVARVLQSYKYCGATRAGPRSVMRQGLRDCNHGLEEREGGGNASAACVGLDLVTQTRLKAMQVL